MWTEEGESILAENVYECMFILNSNRYARDPSGVSEQVNKLIEDSQAEILASILWNEQKLAYPIEGHRKGTYWLTYFRMESQKLGEFNRACQLNDTVLRSLALKVDPRLADTLVGHATGKRAPSAEAETKPAAKASDGAASDGADAKTPAADAASDGAASDGADAKTPAADTADKEA